MLYEIRQLIECSYASLVPFAQHIVRIKPVDRPGQRLLSAIVDITPQPILRSESIDFFGNYSVRLDLDTPHDRLRIQVLARVEVEAQLPLLPEFKDVMNNAIVLQRK